MSGVDRMNRVEPPPDADERTLLTAFLDYHRATLRMKVAGLDATGLRVTLPPGDLTLGGMLAHLAYVEHVWSSRLAGEPWGAPWNAVDWDTDPDWDWSSAAGRSPADLLALLDAETVRADAIYAGLDLDHVAPVPNRRTGARVSLRWALLHLIEEYARHNGHADLIRQSVDGSVGE